MSNFKEKSQVFIIGLMTGLIIAGAFFVLKLDDYFKELNFYKNIAKTFVEDSKGKEFIKADDKIVIKEKKSKSNFINNKSATNIDSSAIAKEETDFLVDADTLNDFIAMDSATIKISSVSEDIVLRKDELLFTKTIEVINLSPVATQTSSKDSLLKKVTGIKENKNNIKQLVNIELWQSPLNYKGYKMSKNKIALYDIASVDGLLVYILNDVVYLKHGPVVYKLENSSEFRPYERITDDSLISKLK